MGRKSLRKNSGCAKVLKLAIGYSYLNGEKEHPRALKPWIPIVDHVIAINGRYWTPQSPEMRKKNYSRFSTDNSYRVLKEVCGDKLVHEEFYGTQMEKRQRCLDIAGELGCDYLIVWDTDDYIHPEYQEWNFFRKQLEHELKFPNHRIYDMWAWIPDEILWSKQHNGISSNVWTQYARIHKNPGTMRYAHTHWTFADKKVTDDDINLFKWSHNSDVENPHFIKSSNTIDGIRITTDRLLRSSGDLEFGDGWAYQNMHWEAYEYDTKPYWDKHNKGFTLAFELLKRKYPNLEYYFPPPNFRGEVQLTPYYIDKQGRYVIIKPEQTEEALAK